MRLKGFVVGMMALSAASVVAAELSDFLPAEDGATACWQRVYDEAHLASHPDQKVTQMTLAMAHKLFEGADEGMYVFGLDATLRDGTDGTTSGGCSAYEGEVRCGVDCDGGGLALELRDGGSVLADLEAYGYIRMESECGSDGEEASFPIEPGLDDKQFLLHVADAKVCKALTSRW
ncbi:hypothetical protein [Devosia sediminis]|uniref:Uncharacterized protein n=1 Tax=Devosia sediminis TaxID=2798801 RepID=A0A934J009_9HYPH|nr:hypothetical protein [Devosia sediminis]MBJ3785315.1 hypothetical protein [Devosia sediminis]